MTDEIGVYFEPIVTAVRVFTTRARRDKKDRIKRSSRKRRYPFEVLVFDTETRIDPSQNLMVGVWRFYRDDPDAKPGTTCIEEGFFYPDDLPETDPDGYRTLVEYAATHQPDTTPGFAHPTAGTGIPCWSVSEWLEKRLYLYGYRHRNRCTIVGFNLPFDLGRLATHWGEGKNNFLGGWSLGIWGKYQGWKWLDHKFHPRINAKPIDPKRTLFAFGYIDPDPDPHLKGLKGMFCDLRALVFALTDKGHSLESACKAFGDEFEKADIEYGVITPELLGYTREDVGHTARLYRLCLDELDKHTGIELEPHRLYSPATVGTQYLKAMGLERPMDKFATPNEIHGYAMSAFFGGRAEARIVRTHLPVAYVDATSMYPTVNALLGTWKLLTANSLDEIDVTTEFRELLADPDLYEKCFSPTFWDTEIGVTLVEVDHPSGALLPVRGEYDELALDPGIGLNPYKYNGTLWYMAPDVINATNLNQQPVPIRRAIRFTPSGIQDGLKPVQLRGGRTIDPTKEDPFVAFIEYRHETKANKSLPKEERDRLDQFLKITANATAYGVLARFDRRQFSKPKTVTVYGPDEPLETKTKRPEDPGPYCHPLIAATITAGARLLLGMLERAVTDAGGHYVLCDTDSMVIVTSKTGEPVECDTPDGTNQITPLQPADVRAILDQFRPLNPYNQAIIPELWTEEHDSINEPIWCYAISTKRYVLYRKTASGETEIVDWSEHGLGQYLDPTGPDPERDEKGRRVWTRQAWEWVLNNQHQTTAKPSWAELPALTLFTLSTPKIRDWFTGYDNTQPASRRVRPGSFGLIAHTDTFMPAPSDGTPRPTTTYNPDPDTWLELDWYDRTTGQPIQVTTADPHHPDFHTHLQQGRVRINTLGDVLGTFRTRPEHKSLDPHGDPTTGETSGLLLRRPVESAPVLTDLIGKEGNDLEERATGLTYDPDDYRSQYGNRGERWTQLVLPILKQLGLEEVMKRTGREKSVVYEILAGKRPKYDSPAARYREVAIEAAAEELERAGVRVPLHPYGILYFRLRSMEMHGDQD